MDKIDIIDIIFYHMYFMASLSGQNIWNLS